MLLAARGPTSSPWPVRLGANLRDANLGRDNLGGATQLQGASLAGAQLERAALTGAEYDDSTIFPEGFAPQASGMRKAAP